jgi:hypothetical protein
MNKCFRRSQLLQNHKLRHRQLVTSTTVNKITGVQNISVVINDLSVIGGIVIHIKNELEVIDEH